jgi:hypothetical protein
MAEQQPPKDPPRRTSRPRQTPAELSAVHAATQARLKQEAAARRAVGKGGSPRASGTTRIGHGHRSSG